ncbi:MAG: hypothetical protein HY928_11080 [Elusimicrobia bacterium]|nr:hypothetical protein [Elusimicrobiota bacterium]
MSDLTRRGKGLFWALAVTVLLLAGVPSIVLVESARDYWRFLRGWDPAVLRPSTVRRLPHHDDAPEDFPDIRFVEFSLRAPGAKKVRLAANFNGFDPAALALDKGAKDDWKTVVPLPPGSYEYAFDVDGRWTLDPEAGAPVSRGGRDLSVRTVK